MRHFLYDSETYKNYNLHAFRCLETNKVTTFDALDDEEFDRVGLANFLRNTTLITFNYNQYDMLILAAALAGLPLKIIKEISDAIIVHGASSWDIMRRYSLKRPTVDVIDLIEVAPGKASLKIYNGRLHGKRMQDLPIPPDAVLTEDQARGVARYCVNDLAATGLLFTTLAEQMALREEMSETYDVDLRSKSDAQIAEAVIVKRLAEILGETPERPKIAPGTTYRYQTPPYLVYETKPLKDILAAVQETDFTVASNGSIEMPKVLASAAIKIGDGVYRMGIGGLHSSESSVVHFADDETLLCDRDVASYYPAIILTLGLYPPHLGKAFLKVYKKIVDERLVAKGKAKDAKKAKDEAEEKHWTTIANSLKITVNGSFGKLGSKWSALYAPNLMVQVTLTGQLALLLLIERFEVAGIPVVSANTDGVVIKCPKAREADMLAIIKQWETDTGFETEEARYRALYSRDVNNYIAIKDDGSTKRKGAFASSNLKKNPLGLQKNPTNEIALDAVEAFLSKGTPLEETIVACEDIRQFVTVRTVSGGAWDQDGAYLGKAIRWYYAVDRNGPLTNKKGDRVPRSEGARPIMDLPDEFPNDVDYGWYVEEAKSMLRDLGFYGAPTKLTKRQVLGRLVLLAGVL